MKEVIDQSMTLQVEINSLIEERIKLSNQVKQLKLKEDKLRKKLEACRPIELTISSHAIERYKQRIMDIPKAAIKKMLNDPELYRQHKAFGMGRFKSPALPNVIAVINQFTVITVYEESNVFLKLRVLRIYMSYFVDKIAKSEKPLSFEHYYDQFDFKNLKQPTEYTYKFKLTPKTT